MNESQLVVEVPTQPAPVIDVIVQPDHLNVGLEALVTQVDRPGRQGRNNCYCNASLNFLYAANGQRPRNYLRSFCSPFGSIPHLNKLKKY